MNWLDTETQSILQRESGAKLAPPKVGEFALILLKEGSDFKRLVRALQNINHIDEEAATQLACLRLPYVVNHGLTESEAMQGQFELICCDSISVFLRSEVLSGQTDPAYLQALFQDTLGSSEFQLVCINIFHVPETESAEKFLEQFLGTFRNLGFPVSIIGPFKKARIMKHWAERIGLQIECIPTGPNHRR